MQMRTGNRKYSFEQVHTHRMNTSSLVRAETRHTLSPQCLENWQSLLQTFEHLVDPQVAIVGVDDYAQQTQQDHADGGSKRPVQGADDSLENEIGDHFISRPPQDHGRKIGP